MKKTIFGEEAFQVIAHSFSVYSDSAYTLAYSSDGIHYTNWEEGTTAGETLFVVNVPKNAYFKLVGNGSQATISY